MDVNISQNRQKGFKTVVEKIPKLFVQQSKGPLCSVQRHLQLSTRAGRSEGGCFIVERLGGEGRLEEKGSFVCSLWLHPNKLDN